MQKIVYSHFLSDLFPEAYYWTMWPIFAITRQRVCYFWTFQMHTLKNKKTMQQTNATACYSIDMVLLGYFKVFYIIYFYT